MNDATIMVQVAAKYAYESISSGKFPGGPPFFDAARKDLTSREGVHGVPDDCKDNTGTCCYTKCMHNGMVCRFCYSVREPKFFCLYKSTNVWGTREKVFVISIVELPGNSTAFWLYVVKFRSITKRSVPGILTFYLLVIICFSTKRKNLKTWFQLEQMSALKIFMTVKRSRQMCIVSRVFSREAGQARSLNRDNLGGFLKEEGKNVLNCRKACRKAGRKDDSETRYYPTVLLRGVEEEDGCNRGSGGGGGGGGGGVDMAAADLHGASLSSTGHFRTIKRQRTGHVGGILATSSKGIYVCTESTYAA
uniref:Uncharacterized protein n=1 Tax=Vespula pensylvanica TaxID=30213 RepID=A0A834P1Y4_VESPE|nr:hypothetical protein H0235_007778 [Vespula pensylvanica]